MIIVELREKMGEELKDAEKAGKKDKLSPETLLSDKESQDVMLALTGLGFTKQECVAVLTKAKAENVQGVQALIAYCLKHIK